MADNVFDELGAQPIEGLEHLGRAITDAAGVPSGSPANYEATRGLSGAQAPVDVNAIVANLATDAALQIPE